MAVLLDYCEIYNISVTIPPPEFLYNVFKIDSHRFVDDVPVPVFGMPTSVFGISFGVKVQSMQPSRLILVTQETSGNGENLISAASGVIWA